MKIICVGRNYAEHAAELQNEVPKEPVIFLKPDTAILPKKQPFFIPEFSEDVHHELELVVKIKKVGKHISKRFAHKYYDQITVGIDFTARDMQTKLKKKGLPWELSKGFDGAAVVGKFVSKTDFEDVNKLSMRLDKNGDTVQYGNTGDMIFDIDDIICHVSKYFTLKIGDLIYTGTPAGVARVAPEDRLQGYLEEQELFSIKVK